MATPQSAGELIQYLHLKLAALGQPAGKNLNDSDLLQIAQPLLRNYYEKERILGSYLCPADARIQSFLDEHLRDCCSGGVPRLPTTTFVLDRAGLARTMSLPPDANSFASPYLRSYRVPQGVLHNPHSDRRTTSGVFHIAEGGFPIPADKQAVPLQAFAALFLAALHPAAWCSRLFRLPPDRRIRRACSFRCCFGLSSVLPLAPTRTKAWRLASSLPEAWLAIWISSSRFSATAAIRIFRRMTPR